MKEIEVTSDVALPSDRAVMPSAPSPAVSAVPVSIPSAAWLVVLIADFQTMPSRQFRDQYPQFIEERDQFRKAGWSSYEAAFETVIAHAVLIASAMSARSDETGTGSVRQDASAGPQDDAQ